MRQVLEVVRVWGDMVVVVPDLYRAANGDGRMGEVGSGMGARASSFSTRTTQMLAEPTRTTDLTAPGRHITA
jgi:hypothetical protein